MTDTPVTDTEIEDARNVALYYEGRKNPKESDPRPLVVPADFSRQLERELTAAKAEVERLTRERYEYRSMLCPACGGNDHDTPCAYPSEGQPGCFRDRRMSAQNICSRALYDKAYAKGFADMKQKSVTALKVRAAAEDDLAQTYQNDGLSTSAQICDEVSKLLYKAAAEIRAMKPEESHD